MIISGKRTPSNAITLGKIQKELNARVKKAVDDNVPIGDILKHKEQSDLDRLFKIDVASKHKNINYIVETLKCGDSLYISRALKCIWLYDDEHSNVINPEYLHRNVFTCMSMKMKKKLLTAVSMHVRNEKRAEIFFLYCMNPETRLRHFAFKYLIFTSFKLKKDMIVNKMETLRSLIREKSDIRFFVGNNMLLAKYFLENISNGEISEILYIFRYLSCVDIDKYFNWLEHYLDSEDRRGQCFGRRISKEILKYHNSQILNNVPLYTTLLRNDILVRNINVDQAKQYAVALLPEKVDSFWHAFRNFYILDVIHLEEKYKFVKKIFHEKYPDQEFETAECFYYNNYYNLMTVEERESWALNHLANKHFILRINYWDTKYCKDVNYLWYRFINFDVAVKAIKKYILITPDANKRAEIINVLIESARNQSDIENLLKYYYGRHVNESRGIKTSFLLKVIRHHNVFEFSDSSWTAFEKLLYSIEVYNKAERPTNCECFLQVSLVYHLTHKRQFPQGLQEYIESSIVWDNWLEKCLDQVNSVKKEIVYEFLIQLHAKKVRKLVINIFFFHGNVISELRKHISFIDDLQKYYKKPMKDRPTVVLMCMNLFSRARKENTSTISEGHILRFLKQDSLLAIDKLEQIKYNIENNPSFRLNIFIKKVKTYFPDHVCQKYLDFFKQSLSEGCNHRLVFTSVYGIFQLADETFKSDFMNKYAPSDSKIDHLTLPRHSLYIQEAICRFACYSRQPVPLSNMLQYITGDYLHYCKPMFNIYLTTLPPDVCLQFVESLLNSPVSVQKHALRLAFQCYNVENLKDLVYNAWNKSNNISLRMVIYSYLFRDMLIRDKRYQAYVFEIILDFTVDLNEDDHGDNFNLCNKLPHNLRGVYLETILKTLREFQNPWDLYWLAGVLDDCTSHANLMNRETLRIFSEDFLHELFEEKRIITEDNYIQESVPEIYFPIYRAKIRLFLAFIVTYVNEEDRKIVMDLLNQVLTKCLELWNDTYISDIKNTETYFSRVFCVSFIDNLIEFNYKLKNNNFAMINHVLEHVLQVVIKALPICEVYILIWNLKTAIVINILADEYITENNSDNLQGIMKILATKVKEIIDEFIQKGIFYTSLYDDISVVILERINNLNSVLSLCTSSDYLKALLCTELVNYKIAEIVLLATKMFSCSGRKCLEILYPKDNLARKWENIRTIDNLEVQCVFHNELTKCDFIFAR